MVTTYGKEDDNIMMEKGEILQMLGEAADELFVAATKMSYVGRNSELVMYDDISKIDDVRASLRKLSAWIEKEMGK